MQEAFIDNDYISCQANGKVHSLSAMNIALKKLCMRNGLPAVTVHGLRHMVYEKGERFENRNKSLSKKDDAVLGRYRYSEYVPNDRRAWEAALYQEERKREKMRRGKIEEHIRKLAV